MSIDKTRDLPEPDEQDLEIKSFETTPFEDSEHPTVPPGDSTNVLPDLSSSSPKKQLKETVLRKTIGAFEVIGLLGKGGCGEVYRAYDKKLEREVAIKLVRSKFRGDALEHLLSEAKTVASLDSNPHIVPVYYYDVLREPGETDPVPYIVSKLIDGSDFKKRLVAGRPTTRQILTIIRDIAEALHFAHSKGLIHRDVKPENILLDKNDHAYLADFGIAKKESDHSDRSFAGTIMYMSPEQARGEGHLLTRQSDIYSLGLVLYEALSSYPHRVHGFNSLHKCVCVGQVESPRVLNPAVTIEQERVCMKALAPRPSDRFESAKEFADELQWLLDHHLGSNAKGNKDSNVPVVPKGLRSFDAKDSDFFLRLLPGPYDRDGVPESLRFWKNRIESSHNTFRVGLVYGPSGCGKSSQIKAGLLPRLWEKTLSVYIEATPDDTESRLKLAIKNRIPRAQGESLSELICNIRKDRLAGINGKLVLVIDQFEQWLVARDQYETQELTDALRQCDGESVQAILMVRDDFWLAVSRFLKCLDIPIVERENSAMVDLFEIDHAEKVLGLFGQAYGRLDKDMTQWSQANREFIRSTVEGLARNRKIVSVRLALFAEMMKGRQWVPESLKAVGGTDGVGITFLEETFNSPSAPAAYRAHAVAVQGFLGALLPDPGLEIKGVKKTVSHLAEASGYKDRPDEFGELIRILHRELRLITAVSEEKPQTAAHDAENDTPSDISSSMSYQLTHDYLVRPLREWLTRKRKETRQGRAELMLQERVGIWRDKKENKQLPSLPETLSIYYYTLRSSWDTDERAMMAKSLRVHTSIWGGALATLMMISAILWYINWDAKSKQGVEALVESGPGAPIFINLRELRDCPKWMVRKHLESHLRNNPKLSLKMACAFFDIPLDNNSNDSDAKKFSSAQLVEAVIATDPDLNTKFTLVRDDTLNIALALDKQAKQSKEVISETFRNLVAKTPEPNQSEKRIIWQKRSRLALIALMLGFDELAKTVCDTTAQDLAERSIFIEELKNWRFERMATDVEVKNLERTHGAREIQSLSSLINKLDQESRGSDKVTSRRSLDLLSGVCLGLGGIDHELFPLDPQKGDVITKKLNDLYSTHPDASIHSSTEWTLRTWNKIEKLESLNPDDKDKEWGWYVRHPEKAENDNQNKLTFIRHSTSNGNWWVSSQEINQSIFQNFLDSTKSSDKIINDESSKDFFQTDILEECRSTVTTKRGNKPIQNVDLYVAMQFCNFLSCADELKPCYRFGEKDGITFYSETKKTYPPITYELSANGYRLPDENLWKSICYGDKETSFPFGSFESEDEMIDSYVHWQGRFFREESSPCGEKKPNFLGFFDLLGNTHEWLEPPQNIDLERLHEMKLSLAGGCYRDRGNSLNYREWNDPFPKIEQNAWMSKNCGLRIVRPILDTK